MSMLSVFVLLSCMLALSWACCTPTQWEGVEGAVAGYSKYHKNGLIWSTTRAFYDYDNKRVAAFLNYHNGKYENRFQIVKRYDAKGNGGRLYVVDEKRKTCWKKALEKPFRQACIPKEAKHTGDFFLGLTGVMKVSSYAFECEHFGGSVTVMPLKDDPQVCVPVGEIIVGGKRGFGMLENVGFVDVQPKISNTSVFDVPELCAEKDNSLMEEMLREHYILAV